MWFWGLLLCCEGPFSPMSMGVHEEWGCPLVGGRSHPGLHKEHSFPATRHCPWIISPGNSQSSSHSQLEARDVCVDHTRFPGRDKEFPGEPALMDTGMCFCGRHCCQPGNVQPSCCFFLLWRALATGGEQPCPITLLPFSSFVFCHSVTHELPELQPCSMLCRAMTEQKKEKAHPLLQEAENHRNT